MKNKPQMQGIFTTKRDLEQKIQTIPEKPITPIQIIQYMFIHDYSMTDNPNNNDMLQLLEKLVILYERYVHTSSYSPSESIIKKMEREYWNQLKMILIRNMNAKFDYMITKASIPKELEKMPSRINEIKCLLVNIQECLEKL